MKKMVLVVVVLIGLMKHANAQLTAYAGNDGVFCSGFYWQMNASATGGTAGYTFSWTPAIGLSNPNISNPQASPNSTTTYFLTVIDASSNTATDSMIVNVTTTPTSTFSLPSSICFGQPASAVYTGNAPPTATYGWMINNNATMNPGGISQGPQALTFPVSNMSYFVALTVSDSNCVSYQSIANIFVYDINASPNILISSNVTQHTAIIHWDNIPCGIGYQIYFRRSQYTNWQYANVTAGSTSFTLANLQNDYNVQWKIRTKFSSTTYSAWSPVQVFHTAL